MFYEVIYENGDSSVMCCDSDEEALEGIKAANERAMKGEKSLSSDPNSPPAVRIKRVLAYEEHPGSLYEDGKLTSKEVTEAVTAMAKNGSVDIPALSAQLSNLIDPRINNAAPHESKYHMKETRELKATDWEATGV